MQPGSRGGLGDLRAWGNRMTRAMRARVVCARVLLACFLVAYPLPLFSVRRKESPRPVVWAFSVFDFRGGGYSFLPGQPGRRELAGCAVVEAVVRLLADRDQIPLGPLQLRIILDRIDMVDCRRLDAPTVPQRFAAQTFVPAKDPRAQRQPSLALVVHRQKRKAP